MSEGNHGAACRHYNVVAQAIVYVRTHADRQPELDEVAAAVGLSPFHLQRVFSAWAGLSPKRFLQYLTKERARHALKYEQSVFAVADAVGLSGGGRLHDLMVCCDAMSPGEIRSRGAGLEVRYGCGPTPFGHALVAWTGRGICHLAFRSECGPDWQNALLLELATLWPCAQRIPDELAAVALLADVFSQSSNGVTPRLLLRGTNFQLKVWEALLRIAPGKVVSYGELARRAGVPNAARAVGNALAANVIAALIPCHRVIRESGEIGHYRWGGERKMAMLLRETSLPGDGG
jgi:AraC family transcriptional regulator of adaptative response/methylated-DNA-[protein]-cysteine methyltransferase